jgi:hypothetical protein
MDRHLDIARLFTARLNRRNFVVGWFSTLGVADMARVDGFGERRGRCDGRAELTG